MSSLPMYGAASLMPQSSGKGDLWIVAFAKLSDEDQAKLDFGVLDRRSLLQDLHQILQQKQRICLDKQLKYVNRKGEVVIVRDLFEKITFYVQKFMVVVDTAVQYDPGHAALPWAAVRFLLQLAVNTAEVRSTVAETLERISEIITRYAIVEMMYLDASSTKMPTLEEQVAKLYTALLECMAKLSRYFGQSKSKAFLKTPFTNFEQDIIPHISAIESIDVEIQAILHLHDREDQTKIASSVYQTVSGVQSLTQSLNDVHFDISSKLSSAEDQNRLRQEVVSHGLSTVHFTLAKMKDELSGPLQRMSLQADYADDMLTEKERVEVLLWLSSIAYRKHHKSMCADILPGSCTWLQSHTVFRKWINDSVSSVLWLHGIPGSGKSKLVAYTLQKFLDASQSDTNSAPVAFFYCIRATAEPERANPDQILRAILKQLAKAKSTTPLHPKIRVKYESAKEEARDDGSDLTPLSISECVAMILDILQDTSVTIFIDALDECNPSRRHELLQALRKIVSEASNVVKIFVSSRDHADIVNKLLDVPNIYIESTDNFEDIKNFITSRIDQAIDDQRLLNGAVSPVLRDQIIRVLSDKANGMFLWAQLQIENICDFERIQLAEDLQQELGNVPETLHQLYEDAMDQISRKGQRARAGAFKAFRWILVSEQPLSLQGLVHAVSDSTGVDLKISDVVSICNNLIVVDQEFRIFRLAHLSVREYLESREDFSEALVNNEIALQCIKSCQNVLAHGVANAGNLNASRYHDYALLYWPVHCYYARTDMQPNLIQLLSDFFKNYQDQDSTYTLWMNVIMQLRRNQIAETWPIWYKLASSKPPNPLFLVITFAIDICLDQLASSLDHNIDTRNAFELSALALACNLGNHHAAEALIAGGAELNVNPRFEGHIPDGEWQINPLAAAVKQGDAGFVRLLLAFGANVDTGLAMDDGFILAVHSYAIAPINIAAARGDVEILRLLLETVSPNSEHVSHALMHAAGGGQKDACCFLLSIGAKLNEHSHHTNGGPLEKAAEGGFIDVVETLTQNGAIIDGAMKSWDGTALARAACAGHLDVVQYLLDHGADPNAKTSHFGTPFLCAVQSGSQAVVHTMLMRGSDVNASSINGPALVIAIFQGHDHLIPLLVKHGVELSQPILHHEEKFDNAVEFVAFDGSLEMLRSIIGIADTIGAEYDLSRLLLAAARGHGIGAGHREDRRPMISWLLEKGADPNSKTGTSALHIAANRLELDLIHELVIHGAQLGSMCGRMGSVLQAAFFPDMSLFSREKEVNGKRLLPAVFVLLVELGIDINAIGGQLGDALQAAAHWGQWREVEQLTNLGASPVIGVGKFGSALHAAAACAQTKTVEVLLQADYNVNVLCEPYGTPLHAVCCRGRLPKSQLAPEDRYQSDDDLFSESPNKLFGVEFESYDEVFNLLMTRGADVHLCGGELHTALAAAAYAGNARFVESLLVVGATVNVRGGFFDNCLQAVAAGEIEDWGWGLRSSGYTVSKNSLVFPKDTEPKPYDHACAMEIVLAHGGDELVNAEGGHFGTPLQAAAHSGNRILVQQLLDADAKVVEDGNGFYGGCVSAAIGFTRKRHQHREDRRLEYYTGAVECLNLLLEHTPVTEFEDICTKALHRAQDDHNVGGAAILRKAVAVMVQQRKIVLSGHIFDDPPEQTDHEALQQYLDGTGIFDESDE